MSKSEWVEVIEECQSSGNSIKSWCEQNGVKYSSYLYWARKVKGEKREWAKVNISAAKDSKEIKINCNKWTIIIEEGVSIGLLTDVLKAVDSVCC
jgi:TusA-related sulfurtransferase